MGVRVGDRSEMRLGVHCVHCYGQHCMKFRDSFSGQPMRCSEARRDAHGKKDCWEDFMTGEKRKGGFGG